MKIGSGQGNFSPLISPNSPSDVSTAKIKNEIEFEKSQTLRIAGWIGCGPLVVRRCKDSSIGFDHIEDDLHPPMVAKTSYGFNSIRGIVRHMISTLAFALVTAKPPYYLAVDRLIVGSLQNKVWSKLETVESKKGSIKFTKVGLGKINGTWTANGLIKGGANDAGYVDGDGSTTPDGTLFSGPVKTPRSVKLLSNSNSTYVTVLKKFLSKNGIASRARITKVVMTDLDGNGTQEVIIEASNRDDLDNHGMHGSLNGDYSLVLLRYESKGKVVEYALAFDHPKAEEMNYINKLVSIADFDGDGVMEVVVTSNYYEGQSASLFRYKSTMVKKLVEMGDGV